MIVFSPILFSRGRSRRAMLCALLVLPALCAGTAALLGGCGSSSGDSLSGSGTSTTPGTARSTPVNFAVNWASRTRALTAPGSALSAVVVLKNAAPNGTDFVVGNINRDVTQLAAYTQPVTSTAAAKVGAALLHVTFYAQPNGLGDVVGTADAPVTIAADGSGIGSISAAGRVASVTVAATRFSLDVTQDLPFTTKDAAGNLLAVTPGSAQFAVTSGGDKLQVTPGGTATGVGVGTATVTATVDGVVSAAQPVAVSYIGGGTLQGVSVQNNDGSTAHAVGRAGTLPVDGTVAAPGTNGSSTQAVNGGNILGAVQAVEKLVAINVGVEGRPDYYRLDVSGAGRAEKGLRSLTGRDQSACGAVCGGIGKKYPTILHASAGAGATRAAGGSTYNIVMYLPVGYTGGNFTLIIVTEGPSGRSSPVRLPITINTQGVASGKLQFTMTWGQPVDLDLHVKTPDGDEIGYDHRQGTSGGSLDLDSNAACTLDNIDNENITWIGTDPKPGTYVIRPNYWSNCTVTTPIPYTIRVNKNGALSSYQGTFDPSEANQNSGGDPAKLITITVP